MALAHLRRPARAAIAVLALVLAFVQAARASAAACEPARTAHDACKCCEERQANADPVIAGECCAVEESGAHSAPTPTPGTTQPALMLAAPAPVAAITPAPPAISAATIIPDIEVRTAGPPLWLRTRSLRL